MKNWLYRVLILVVCTAVIVYFLPREREKNFQFEVGHPWPYSQLMAEFDFPIYKTQDLVRHETDSVLRTFTPYYQELDSVPVQQMRLIRESMDPLETTKVQERSLIMKAIQYVYRQGVIDSQEYSQLLADSLQQVTIYRQRQASRRQISQLFSVKTAYEYLLSDSADLNRNLLRQLPLTELLKPNLQYDEARSKEVKDDLLASVSLTSDMVFAGTKIVDRGELVTPIIQQILTSWEIENDRRHNELQQNRWYLLSGQIIFVTIILSIFMTFLSMFRKDYFDHKRSVILLFGIIVTFAVLTALMVRSNLFNVYILPYAMVPIIIRILMDSRTAFMATIVAVFLCSMTLRFPYEFILVQTLSGLASILSLRELSQRSQLIRTVVIITAVNVLFYFGYNLIHENDLSKLDISVYRYFCISGVLLLFVYPLLYILERTFHFTSDVTLVELSNINNPLLQRLSEVAPGTFQHSMQVANLAAEAAKRIDAKPQLVRTGALYHDIGKMKDPVFFTENQSGINPHQQLDEMQSAAIIIEHVNYGLKLAEKYSIPTIITDFIRTHHGHGLTKFFYINYQNRHPDETIDKAPFTYPGPNPFTKEQAILMMADSVEAASRSLPQHTEESISQLVDRIIDSQLNDGCFQECPITFQDIAQIKLVFKEKLKTVYHTRIQYPELRK